MDLYFADLFGVDPATLDDYGAFNISLVNDLPLFIDPFLLFNSTNETYQQLHQGIIRYLRFLRDRAAAGEIDEGLLKSWFTFREVKQTWLGYSLVGNSGSGLGLDFARALHQSLHTIFADFGTERVTHGSHLEKVCLIKDGVGRDNISDFTTNLIKEFLLTYTQEFARQHLAPDQRKTVSVRKVCFNYATRTWESDRFELPSYNGSYVILTPKNILTKEDIWINKRDMLRDFDDIAESIPNDELRAQVNDYLARNLADDATQKEVQKVVSEIFRQFPGLIDYYIRYKEEHGDAAVSVSEQQVKEVESVFVHNVSRLIEQLRAEGATYPVGENTYQETRARVLFLKDVIENKGGHRLFYITDEPIHREQDLQILFRLTWFGTTSDISREVNDGRGPVDFKAARGAFDKSLVEFKLAKNTHLKKNLEKQVDIYERASDAKRSLRVIVYFSDGELARVEAVLRELNLQGHQDIILIDARNTNKPSGSKA